MSWCLGYTRSTVTVLHTPPSASFPPLLRTAPPFRLLLLPLPCPPYPRCYLQFGLQWPTAVVQQVQRVQQAAYHLMLAILRWQRQRSSKISVVSLPPGAGASTLRFQIALKSRAASVSTARLLLSGLVQSSSATRHSGARESQD